MGSNRQNNTVIPGPNVQFKLPHLGEMLDACAPRTGSNGGSASCYRLPRYSRSGPTPCPTATGEVSQTCIADRSEYLFISRYTAGETGASALLAHQSPLLSSVYYSEAAPRQWVR